MMAAIGTARLEAGFRSDVLLKGSGGTDFGTKNSTILSTGLYFSFKQFTTIYDFWNLRAEASE